MIYFLLYRSKNILVNYPASAVHDVTKNKSKTYDSLTVEMMFSTTLGSESYVKNHG